MIGERFTSKNRLAAMLMDQEAAAPQVQSHMQGLASMLRQGLAGYMRGADERERTTAHQTMIDALSAPPAERQGPMLSGNVMPAASPYAGAIDALRGLSGNEHAMDMLPGLMSRDMAHRQAADARERDRMNFLTDRAEGRAYQERQDDLAFQRAVELEDLKRKRGLEDVVARLRYQADLQNQNNIRAGIRKQNAERAELGLPPLPEPAFSSGGLPYSPAVSAPQGTPSTQSLPVSQPAPQTPGQNPPQTVAEARAALELEAKRNEEQMKIDLEKLDAAPEKVRTAENLLSVIDQAVQFDDDGSVASTHPGLPDIVGMPGWGGLTTMIPLVGGPVPGTDAASYDAIAKQISGNQFLQAYQALRGGGTITETEGTKAEQAKARLSTAQREEDYIAALKEFRDDIVQQRDRQQGLIDDARLEQVTLPPGVTNDDIRETMRANNMTLDQVLQQLGVQ